ncbi:MAG: hypothetical protein JW738_03925 [Actinobacteria bacterium]|nr:hypothetical protein [Actinomycetota bacterium]
MRKYAKTAIFWLVILFLIVILLLNPPWQDKVDNENLTWLLTQVDQGKVKSVTVYSQDLVVEGKLVA